MPASAHGTTNASSPQSGRSPRSAGFPGHEGHGVGEAVPGHEGDRRRGLVPVSADHVPHAAVPRLLVRALELQCRGSGDPLALHTGSDRFGGSVMFAKGSSRSSRERCPRRRLLSWATFSEAADQAGISRRYGGIHFEQGDIDARRTGARGAAGLGGGARVLQRHGLTGCRAHSRQPAVPSPKRRKPRSARGRASRSRSRADRNQT